jgi:transcriptional regulator with XRE-family HTH domain
MSNRVREIREKQGISQAELSRRIQIASQNLSAIELGKMEAWPKVRRKIAKALGVSQTELFPEAS